MPEKQPDRIHIASSADLAAHFDDIHQALAVKETEDSWQKLDRALLKLEAVTKGGGYKFDDFIPQMKAVAGPLSRSLLSERTKLSGTAADVLNSVAPRLADRFEALVNFYVPPLLALCARTNKVALKRAEKCLYLIARHCRLVSTLPLLREACKDKFAGLRVVAVATMAMTVEYAGRDRLMRKVAEVETAIRTSATDSNVEVRQNSKRLFEVYVSTWPDRVESFTSAFTPTIRRYLALPKTGAYRPAPAVFASALEPASSSPVQEARAQSFVAPLRVTKTNSTSTHSAAHIPREESSRPNSFLEQLAAAKSRAKAPSHIQSTGALKGLGSADIFGPQRTDKQNERKPTRVVSSSSLSTAALRSSTSTYPSMPSSSKVKLNDDWSHHTRAATHHESTQTPLAVPIPTIQRSFSSSHPPSSAMLASSDDDEASPLAIRESKTAPVTPAAGLHSDSGNESEGSYGFSAAAADEKLEEEAGAPRAEELEQSSAAVPSDGVARRLASMAQEQMRKATRQQVESASTPTQRTASASTSRTPGAGFSNAPKAARVAIPPPVQRPTAATQRQVSATRVARPNAVANLGEPSKAASQPKPAVESKPPIKKTLASVPVKAKPASPKKTGPIKTTGKVVSSTTQALSAKSSAVSRAAPASASNAAGKRKAANVQSAREAVMAKKQAEVAKLRAQAKARSEEAAIKAAASQAQRQAKTKQLREQTHPVASASTGDAQHDAPHTEESHPAGEIVSKAQEVAEARPVAQIASPSAQEHGRGGSSKASSPCKSPATPSRPQQSPASPPRAPRTPFADITAQTRHESMVKANSSPPQETAPLLPFKTSSQRANGAPMSFSSPADKLRAQMEAMSLHAATPKDGEDWQPIEAGPLRLSPIKGRIATPVRATKFGSGRKNVAVHSSPEAGNGSSGDEGLEDQENVTPGRYSGDEYEAKVTLVKDGRRSQLVCQLGAGEDVESDNDTLIEA